MKIEPWITTQDVAAAVKALTGIFEKEGSLPLELAEAYWGLHQRVKGDRPELAKAFRDGLGEACPNALIFIFLEGSL
jgi:hypothetical protein